jgi:peptidoglycan/xylan/chitin deacetylase (PgdA/CDA1 family)
MPFMYKLYAISAGTISPPLRKHANIGKGEESGNMKPLASLSLDLDNEWAYLKTRGDPAWQTLPSYLDRVVPRVLELLSRLNLRITFFVVGLDAAQPKNRPSLERIAAAGHEIGNHSLRHEPWLHLYSEEALDDELAQAEAHIEAATGRRPDAFRGPGYSLSAAALRVLIRRGYRYDASTFPTFLGPLARAYYFATARLSAEERRQRAGLFGSLRDGLRPLRPFRWQLDTGTMLEIPVTTFPVLRVPIHLSYVLYIAGISPLVARAYFEVALRSCRLARVEPSMLLHPLDFLDEQDVPSLAFFPAMRLAAPVKISIVEHCIKRMQALFDVRPLGEHAAALDARSTLPLLAPSPAL